jgi:5-methylcytosine-specific restriction endonuclease McrA
MTLPEFASIRETRACDHCGKFGVITERNPNNNGLLVRCPQCGSKRPWGSLLYLKQRSTKRAARPPLPDGETLDSIWEKFGNRCVLCSAPKLFLQQVGIGRTVHHVVPFAENGHRGPLIPICSHCHEIANARQRVYWFLRRVVLPSASMVNEEGSPDERSDPHNSEVA